MSKNQDAGIAMSKHVARRLIPRRGGLCLLLSTMILVGTSLGASSLSLPDSEKNQATGKVEVVDTALLDGRQQVRHSVDGGQGEPESSIWLSGLATDNDYEPRISIDDAGNGCVVWWRDATIAQVFYTHRLGTGNFSPPALLSEPSESSEHPEVVIALGKIWVTYEIDFDQARGIAITGKIGESPEPFPSRTVIHTTGFTGTLDTRIHASLDALWITWVDSDIEVGWSEYEIETEEWSPPRFQNYEEDSVDSARALIREQVLGN